MRLIDADALIDNMVAYVADGYAISRVDFESYTKMVQTAPTIEAVSVVHGEWIPNPKIGWGETWVCSICGEKTTSSVMGKPRYRYCPLCGAKMKGADDETR